MAGTSSKAAGKRKAPEPADGARKSSRPKKEVIYNEDEAVKVQEEAKASKSSGGYVAPRDPPGMKSTAYLCKSPPQQPPDAEVYDEMAKPPKRNEKGEWCFADHPKFRPNLSPAEVMKSGAFGGTYYRPILSAVTGEKYTDAHKEFPVEWWKGVPERDLAGKTYRAAVNKYNVECGGALDMWESSGWITSIDPYGWYQWYCRFFQGRRSSDDERQISRWAGVASNKGRFRNQLLNKVIAANASFDDPRISPVIRQTLLHWAYEVTESDLEQAKKGK